MDELFPSVEARIRSMKNRKSEEFARKKGNNLCPTEDVPMGSAVMIWDPVLHNKNESPYTGPYILDEQVSEGRFILKDPATGEPLKKHYTLDQLKICRLATLEMKDMESYPVDYIVDHKLEDGKHVYKVKWVGFNEESDQWLEAGRIDPIPIRDYHNRATRMIRTAKDEQERVVKRNLEKRVVEEKSTLDLTLAPPKERERQNTTTAASASWRHEHIDKSVSTRKKDPSQAEVEESKEESIAGAKEVMKRKPTESLRETGDVYKKTYRSNLRK